MNMGVGCPFRAEQVASCVDPGGIHQPARPEMDPRVSFVILSHRLVVVNARSILTLGVNLLTQYYAAR